MVGIVFFFLNKLIGTEKQLEKKLVWLIWSKWADTVQQLHLRIFCLHLLDVLTEVLERYSRGFPSPRRRHGLNKNLQNSRGNTPALLISVDNLHMKLTKYSPGMDYIKQSGHWLQDSLPFRVIWRGEGLGKKTDSIHLKTGFTSCLFFTYLHY